MSTWKFGLRATTDAGGEEELWFTRSGRVMSEATSPALGVAVQRRGSVFAEMAGGAIGGLAGLTVAIAIAAVFDIFQAVWLTFLLAIVGSFVGHAVASKVRSRHDGSSSVVVPEHGYLTMQSDRLVLYAATTGAFKSAKPIDEVLATMPISAMESVHVQRHNLAGSLEFRFVDGSSWSFDVSRPNLDAARQICTALTSPPVPATAHAPGWYADPRHKYALRYWDGLSWTAHVSDGGALSNDAL